MKRLLSTAAALLMMTGVASANRQLVVSGYWSTHYRTTTSDGVPMCLMRATWGPPSGVQGFLFVKWSPKTGMFFHVAKTDWNFAADQKVPVQITWDRGTREATGTTIKAENGVSMIEINVESEFITPVVKDLSESSTMVITFLSGNEPPWHANMNGSREATRHFSYCAKWVADRYKEPTSPVAKTPPTSPVGPPSSTSPVGPPPLRKNQRDNGSI